MAVVADRVHWIPVYFLLGKHWPASALQTAKRNHGLQSMMVQPYPGSAFVVVQAEFILEVLMRLFAHPAGLDHTYQRLARHASRMVAEIILALAVRTPLAHLPCGLTKKMLRM